MIDLSGLKGLIVRTLGAILSIAAATACGSAEPDPTGSQGSITLAFTASALTVEAGEQGQIAAVVTRNGGFSGAIGYRLSGQPPDVTVLVREEAHGGATTAVVTVTAVAAAAPGSYPLTLHATGAGVQEATASFTLTIVPGTPASYGLFPAFTTVTVVQGSTGGTSIQIARTQFQGPVTLVAELLPTGVTGTFDPSPTTGNSSTVTLTAVFAAPPGTYAFLIRGTAAGLSDVTTQVTLVVQPAPAITLSAGAHTLNVLQGAATSTFVKVTRSGNVTGAGTFSATGAPPGMIPSVATTLVTDSLTLTVTTVAALAPGTYPVVVRAAFAGAADQTLTIRIVVAARAGVDVRLDFTRCLPHQPQVMWVAYRDGTGAWNRVPGNGNVYAFHADSATGGVAIVRFLVQFFLTDVQFLTQAELQAATGACSSDFLVPGQLGRTLHGTFARLDAGDFGVVSMGGVGTTATGPATAFTLTDVLDGPQDMLALRSDFLPMTTRDRMVLRRDLDIPGGGSLAVIDFAGAESFTPLSANFGVSGYAAGESSLIQLYYASGASCTRNLVYSLGSTFQGSAMTVPLPGIPAARQRTSDLHLLLAEEQSFGTGGLRRVTATFHDFTALDIVFGATLPRTASLTNLPGPYARLQAAYLLPDDYDTAGLFYHDGQGRLFTVSASAAYRGTRSALLTVPELSAVTGFDAATWAPRSVVQRKLFARSVAVPPECSEGRVRYAEQTVPG
jgi:hypothetical protein